MTRISCQKVIPAFFLAVILSCLGTVSQAKVINRIVAKVNDRIITQEELDEAVQASLIEMKGKEKVDPAELKKKILERKIEESLLSQEAVRLGIQARDKEVEEDVKQVRSQFQSEEIFEAALEHNHLTLDMFKAHRRSQLIIHKVLQGLNKDLDASDEEIQKFYEAHKDQFKQPEQVHVRHLLIRFDRSMKKGPARDREETRAANLIQSIKEKLKKKDVSFEDLVAKYSEDTESREKGGDLGIITRGTFDKDFEKAAFAAKVGAVTGPVQTSLGFHLIQVLEHKTDQALGLDDTVEFDGTKDLVRQFAKRALIQEKSQQQVDKYIKDLKEKAIIDIPENQN